VESFFADEHMASMAEHGLLQPFLITLCFSIILAISALCVWSAEGIFVPLSCLWSVLIVITAVYLVSLLPFLLTTPKLLRIVSAFGSLVHLHV
jgi:heme/copper-type cytochrome/quinol oxidase subunit 4